MIKFILCLLLTSTAWSQSLKLSGVVSLKAGIRITPFPVATALPLDQSYFNLPLGNCKGFSNSPYGELPYSVRSLNNGNLKRDHGKELIPYSLMMGQVEIPLDGSPLLMRKGVDLNRTQELSISYELPASNLVPGRYSDTLTFSSLGGEVVSVLSVCGEIENTLSF